MNTSPSLSHTLPPPHLSMDEYVDFVEASIWDANPVFADKQKSIEKRILQPFRLSPLSPNQHH